MTILSPAPAQASPPPREGEESRPLSARPRDLWVRFRAPLALLAAFTLVAVLLSLGAQTPRQGLLEPEGTAGDGTRALVRLLEQDGAEVTVARSADAAVRAAGEGGVLVVTLPHRLPPEELERLAQAPGDRVLVQPTLEALAVLAPGVEMTGRTDEGPLEAGCGLSAATTAGAADLRGELYTAEGVPGAVACYPAQGGAALVRTDDGPAAVTVLGTGEPLTNARLAQQGNAALALNVVGAPEVVWLRPEAPVPTTGDASVWELLPAGLRWAAVPLLAALLLLALWRGRRLGPLVAESLPVVVRASETTEGRAALYRSRRARDRAAAALRARFTEQATPLLGLGADAPPAAVAGALADRTGDDAARLRVLLYGAGPGGDAGHGGAEDPYTVDDASLVRLADDLDRCVERLR